MFLSVVLILFVKFLMAGSIPVFREKLVSCPFNFAVLGLLTQFNENVVRSCLLMFVCVLFAQM